MKGKKFAWFAAPPLILIFMLCLFSAAFSEKMTISLKTVSAGKYLMHLLEAFDTEADANRALTNDIRQFLVTDDYIFNDPNIAVYNSSGTHKVQHDALYFIVNGVLYTKATASITLSGDAVPQAKYGAWAFDVGVNGTVDVTPAAANATGYTTAALAAAGIPAAASDHARLGYMTVTRASPNGTFIPGTTEIGATGVTAAYTDLTPASNIGAAVTEQVTSGN